MYFTKLHNTKPLGEHIPFEPLEWLTFNFSLQYHPWITHEGQENKGNDHQLKPGHASSYLNYSFA